MNGTYLYQSGMEASRVVCVVFVMRSREGSVSPECDARESGYKKLLLCPPCTVICPNLSLPGLLSWSISVSQYNVISHTHTHKQTSVGSVCVCGFTTWQRSVSWVHRLRACVVYIKYVWIQNGWNGFRSCFCLPSSTSLFLVFVCPLKAKGRLALLLTDVWFTCTSAVAHLWQRSKYLRGMNPLELLSPVRGA